MSGLTFAKVDVAPVEAGTSLLSGISREGGSGAGAAPTEAVAEPVSPIKFTVGSVIEQVLRASVDHAVELPSDNPGDFELKICDDDGSVDPDFPVIDCSVSIANIGVPHFVLCEAGTEKMCMHLSIPESTVAHRAYESAHPVAAITVTCSPLGGTSPFPVDLS